MIANFYRLEVLPRLSPELVFAGVEFKRHGRRDWRARCPIHGGNNAQAFSVNPQTLVWNCFTGCGRGGDAVDYVKTTEGLDFSGAVKRLAEIVGVSYLLAEGAISNAAPRPIRTPVPRRPPEPPKRHPQAQIQEFWDQCIPVTDDSDISEYLRKRGLDPVAIEERDLARAVPATGELPRWAWYRGQFWNAAPQQFRLVVRLFGATGRLESVHARALYPQETNGNDKAAAVAGASLKGLVMADALGQLLLADGNLGDGTAAAELVASCGVRIMEGTPDFLTRATDFSDADENAPAVIGILSGSWNNEIAARIPDGTTVAIEAHADPAGDHYAQVIAESLSGRCKLKRSKGAA
jgi:hypothetical protein